ncbi:MAG: hypothetical protein AMXMBFR84_37300 [Candidatus Hydrogenedentota bacterium]
MQEHRLTLTPGMRRLLDYPKFRGRTRMLVLETQYFFDRSWVRAGEALGWEVASVPSVMIGGLTQEQIRGLLTTVVEFKPDFILTSNYAGMDGLGLFARFFEDARIPYVSWFTDTPRMILYNRTVSANPYIVAATWERAYFRHFHDLGFEHVYFMPHATDPALFNRPPADSWERDIAFVGISMVGLAEEAWAKLAPFPEVTAALHEAFASGKVTPEQFAEGVETLVPPEVLAACDSSTRRNLELCLVYEGTRRSREHAVRALGPLNVQVFGDPRWQAITDEAYGQIGYFDGLAGHYHSTAVNVNVTSLQMRSAVNQRVFDCPAAGGFLLTDYRSDLEEWFTLGEDVIVWRSLEELADQSRFYLGHPEIRQKVIDNARKTIHAGHYYVHRLTGLRAYLANIFG